MKGRWDVTGTKIDKEKGKDGLEKGNEGVGKDRSGKIPSVLMYLT